MNENGAPWLTVVGVRLSEALTRVREQSLARATPPMIQATAQVVDAMAQRRARAAEDTLVAWLERNASNSPLPPAVGGLLSGIARIGGFLYQQILGTAIGFGVGGALTSVMEPYFLDMTKAAWESNPVRQHTPEQLAGMVVQGIRGEDQASTEAVKSGSDRLHFEELVRLNGMPPGLAQVVDLWNRGVLTEADFERAIRQSHTKLEWVEPLKALRHVLATPSDLIRFGLREVFSPEVRQKFGYDDDFPQEMVQRGLEIGIKPELLRDYWAAHWVLPSPTQLYTMLHRGLIDEQTLALGLRAADYPSFWRGKLQQIAYRLPTRVDIRRMLVAGVVNRARVLQVYLGLGYEQPDAELLTEFAVTQKLTPEKDLSKTEVVALYVRGVVARDRARGMLERLGYEGEELDLILDLADVKAEGEFQDQAIRTVRSKYVARKITEEEATGALERLRVEPRVIARNMALWDEERDATTRDLTEAQVRAAWLANVVTEQYYRDWLTTRGWSDHEAEVLVRLYGQPGEEGGARELTEAQARKMWADGIITESEYRAHLRSLGYSETDAERLVQTYRPGGETS